MESLCLRLVIFALIFTTGVSSVSIQCRLRSPYKPQGRQLLKIHDCNQSTGRCIASVSGVYTSDCSTDLTMKKSSTTKHMVCIQKTYNGQTHAFKVVSPNEIVFEKLMQGTDCMNSDASIFKRVVVSPYDPKAPFQLISQKHGLPANKKYLAVDWTLSSGPLFLTNSSNRENRFKFLWS